MDICPIAVLWGMVDMPFRQLRFLLRNSKLGIIFSDCKSKLHYPMAPSWDNDDSVNLQAESLVYSIYHFIFK